MRKVLYLVRRPDPVTSTLLAGPRPEDFETTVVLLEEGVRLTDVPGTRVVALAEDAAARQIRPPYATVTYREMIEMLFEADSVIAL